MDLSQVMGVSAESRAQLEAAGVKTPGALARTADLAALSQASGVDPQLLEGLREAARAFVLARLRDAGTSDEASFVAADPEEVAARAGLERADVEWFQALARETLAGLPATRVTLRPGVETARVRVEGDLFESVAVRTSEDAQAALAAWQGNLVLLRPGEATATLRVSGTQHDAVPLFAEAESGEIAVRVREVRAADTGGQAEPKKKGFLSRLRKG